MAPISAAVTAIEEVVILRKAKRLPANARRNFSSVPGRVAARREFERVLARHPFASDAFGRFLSHIKPLLGNGDEDEAAVLGRGWF